MSSNNSLESGEPFIGGADHWWNGDRISQRERQIRVNETSETADPKNDFGAYKRFLETGDVLASGLHLHNEFRDYRVSVICRDYASVLKWFDVSEPESILDIGCGAGFTTSSLKRQWPDAQVSGVDVSLDAVSYATTRWPDCQFHQKALSPETKTLGKTWDLILCQEFYPFTRTSDAAEHSQWIQFLKQNLVNSGVAIITVAGQTTESISKSFSVLRNQLNLRRVAVPVPRLRRLLPFRIAMVVALLMGKFRPSWIRYIYVLRH